MARVFETLIRTVFWGSFLFCFAGGWLCVWFQFRVLLRALASRRWLETSGVIEKAAVREIVTEDEGTTVRSYMPELEYSYQAGGKLQTQSRIRFGSGIYSTGLRFYPRRLLRKYAVRQSVPVFFDPADPSSSVLERGRPGWEHMVMAGFLFGFAAAIWFFVLP